MVYRVDGGAGGADLDRHRRLCTAAAAIMIALYWIALILTVGLFIYLLYAMLRAEDF